MKIAHRIFVIISLFNFEKFHTAANNPPDTAAAAPDLLVGKKTPKVKISRGVYTTEVTGTTLYDSLGAIIFEFRLPDPLANPSPLMYDQPCDTDGFSDDDPASTYTCPVYHHLHRVRDDLDGLIRLTDIRTFPPPTTSWKSAVHLGDCAGLSPHFRGMILSRESVERYLTELSKCLGGRVIQNMGLNTYNQSQLRRPFGLMMSKFVEEYFHRLPPEGRTDLAILLNAMTGFNNLGLIQELAESQRWRDALRECKSGRIPSTLIPPAVFEKSLGKLNESLSGQNMELAVPSSSGISPFVSEYYRERLTDCVLTERSLLVRTLIPARKAGRGWRHVSVRSVPFKLEDNKAGGGGGFICTVREFDHGKTYVFDPVSKDVIQQTCEVEDSRFCRVKDEVGRVVDFRRSCASVVLSGENRKSRLAKFCELHCEEVDRFETPIFTRVGPDKFIIAGNPEESIVAQVDAQVNIIHPVSVGALEVVLPCKGVIMFENRKYFAKEPCGKQYRVVQVQPVHWG